MYINEMSSKKSLAKQLSVKELKDILHKKNLKIPSKWKKTELVPFVEANCTKKEIEEVVKQKVRGRTARERGFEAQYKGKELENRVNRHQKPFSFFFLKPLRS